MERSSTRSAAPTITVVGELLLEDKVISNHKMIERLGVQLRHPGYRGGIAALGEQVQDTR